MNRHNATSNKSHSVVSLLSSDNDDRSDCSNHNGLHEELSADGEYLEWCRLLKEQFKKKTKTNLFARTNAIASIITRTLQNGPTFQVPEAGQEAMMKSIETEIDEWNGIDLILCKSQHKTFKQYQTISRNWFSRNKSRFYGNYFFYPIIFHYVLKHCVSLPLHDKQKMCAFIDILQELLTETIQFPSNKSERLIPHQTLMQPCKFQSKCKEFVLHYNIDWSAMHAVTATRSNVTNRARKVHATFAECLRKCKEKLQSSHHEITHIIPILAAKPSVNMNQPPVDNEHAHSFRRDHESSDVQQQIPNVNQVNNQRANNADEQQHRDSLSGSTATDRRALLRHRTASDSEAQHNQVASNPVALSENNIAMGAVQQPQRTDIAIPPLDFSLNPILSNMAMANPPMMTAAAGMPTIATLAPPNLPLNIVNTAQSQYSEMSGYQLIHAASTPNSALQYRFDPLLAAQQNANANTIQNLLFHANMMNLAGMNTGSMANMAGMNMNANPFRPVSNMHAINVGFHPNSTRNVSAGPQIIDTNDYRIIAGNDGAYIAFKINIPSPRQTFN